MKLQLLLTLSIILVLVNFSASQNSITIYGQTTTQEKKV